MRASKSADQRMLHNNPVDMTIIKASNSSRATVATTRPRTPLHSRLMASRSRVTKHSKARKL